MHGLPKVNKELEGLDITINEFGQIVTSYDIDKINKFLNREVEDKKLVDRDDITKEGEFQNTYKDEKYWNGPLDDEESAGREEEEGDFEEEDGEEE